QRQFEAGIKAGQVAGAAVFTVVNAPESPAYDIALAQVRALGSQVISTLDTIEHRFYARRLRGDLLKVRDGLEATRRAVLITFFVVLLLGVLNAAFLLVGALREERLLSLMDEERIDSQRRTDLETQLQRGLEMEPTEGDTYGVVGAALSLARPNSQTELLLADSSRSHFRQVVSTGSAGAPECPVPSPLECPAAIGGQTRMFSSGTRLDACPFLRDRDDPRKSAA